VEYASPMAVLRWSTAAPSGGAALPATKNIDLFHGCTQNGSIRARPNMAWNRSQKMTTALYFSRSADVGKL